MAKAVFVVVVPVTLVTKTKASLSHHIPMVVNVESLEY